MQSLKYAFRFIKVSFSTAFIRAPLQKQWVYLVLGSLILLLLWCLPLGLIVGLIGLRPIGMLLIGLSGVLSLFSSYAWGNITQLPASQEAAALFGTQADSDAEETQRKIPFEKWVDVFLLTLILPWLRIINLIRKPRKSEEEESQLWMAAQPLLIPVMGVENRGIAQAIDRVNQMIRENLLRFRPGLLKVDLVSHSVQWLLSAIAILAGFSVAVTLTDPLTIDPWRRILGMAAGVLIAWFLITPGILFSTFTRSLYHTALYQWVRNVEIARESGDPNKAIPPVILRDVLGKTKKK